MLLRYLMRCCMKYCDIAKIGSHIEIQRDSQI